MPPPPPAAASAREVLPRECTGEHLPRAARRPSAPAQRSARHHDLGPAAVAALRPARSGRSSLRGARSEEHTSELQSRGHLVCRLLLEKKESQDEAEEHALRRSQEQLAAGR